MALVSGSSPGCASMRMLKDYLLALDPPGDFLVRKARAQFIQFAFSKPSAFNCLSLEQGLISRGKVWQARVSRDDPINYRGQSRELAGNFILIWKFCYCFPFLHFPFCFLFSLFLFLAQGNINKFFNLNLIIKWKIFELTS